MIKQKTIKVPIYNDAIKVVTYEDNKEIYDLYGYEVRDSTDAFVFRDKYRGYIVVCFNKNKVNNRIVLHECIHIVNFIFKQKGISLDLDNDEPQAYLTDWIFENINKALTKLY